MQTLTLVLGNQLFKNHPGLETETDWVMVESANICTRWKYHKQKLAFVIDGMRNYRAFLESQDQTIHYSDLEEQTTLHSQLTKLRASYSTIQIAHVLDASFERTLIPFLEDTFERVVVLNNPMMLTTNSEFDTWLHTKTQKRLLMNDFYIWQRKRLGILLEGDEKPLGGSWSYDEQNRKKIPRGHQLPSRTTSNASPTWQDTAQDIEAYFSDHPGQISPWLATSHQGAQLALESFIQELLPLFGDYEDALYSGHELLYHSALSSYLNVGLLTPQEVLDAILDEFKTNTDLAQNHLNSVEGIVRQIIGWREWVYHLYRTQYHTKLDSYNFFGHDKKLPDYFWDESLIPDEQTPLYDTLRKVFRIGYNHHIERLMVLGNWMVLNEIDPMDCYNWFMSMYVDAYEWVMVANVFGMGTFADGGIFATKPYISGSNYIRKMSNYKPGQWSEEWDQSFWAFLFKHEEFFKTNPRMNMLIASKKKRDQT